MKASEIFLEFAKPARDGLPEELSLEQFKKVFIMPELVWNAVVQDKSQNRKPGQLPNLLMETIAKDIPYDMREMAETTMGFWVCRKDLLFSEHRWLLVTEIYENLKKEIIVRVKVHGTEDLYEHIPEEWKKNKGGARLLSIRENTN